MCVGRDIPVTAQRGIEQAVQPRGGQLEFVTDPAATALLCSAHLRARTSAVDACFFRHVFFFCSCFVFLSSAAMRFSPRRWPSQADTYIADWPDQVDSRYMVQRPASTELSEDRYVEQVTASN